MFLTSSPALNQTKVGGRVVHSVEKRMARRTKNPAAVRRGIPFGSPCSIPAMLRPMRNVQDTIFATRLAGSWGIGMAGVKPLQISVRPKLFTRSGAIFLKLLWVLGVELRSRLAGASRAAFGRAVPTIAFGPTMGEEPAAALPTVAACLQQLPRFSVIPKLLLTPERAEFVPCIRWLKWPPAMAAMLGSAHA